LLPALGRVSRERPAAAWAAGLGAVPRRLDRRDARVRRLADADRPALRHRARNPQGVLHRVGLLLRRAFPGLRATSAAVTLGPGTGAWICAIDAAERHRDVGGRAGRRRRDAASASDPRLGLIRRRKFRSGTALFSTSA